RLMHITPLMNCWIYQNSLPKQATCGEMLPCRLQEYIKGGLPHRRITIQWEIIFWILPNWKKMHSDNWPKRLKNYADEVDEGYRWQVAGYRTRQAAIAHHPRTPHLPPHSCSYLKPHTSYPPPDT